MNCNLKYLNKFIKTFILSCVGRFFLNYDGIKIIALHDLNYPDKEIRAFMDFLNSNYNLAKIKKNKLFFENSKKPKLLLTADDGFADWIKFSDLLKNNFKNVGLICFIPACLYFYPKNKKKELLRKTLHRKTETLRLLSFRELNDLSSYTNVWIASHGYEHENFNRLDQEEILEVLNKSKNIFIKKNIQNYKSHLFCLPYGTKRFFPVDMYKFVKNLHQLAFTVCFLFERKVTNFYPGLLLLPRCGIDPYLSKLEIQGRLNLTQAVKEFEFENFICCK